MSIAIFISGVQVPPSRVHLPSLQIQHTLGQRATLSVRLNSGDNSWSPPTGVDIAAYVVGLSSYRVFGGLIHSVSRKREPGSSLRVNDVEAVGYEWLLDRRSTGVRTYTSQNANDIILDIMAQVINGGGGADGIDPSDVTPGGGPIIDNITFENPTVADAFNQITELTGLRWFIDPDKRLQVIDPSSPDIIANINQGAPFPLADTGNYYADPGISINETLEQFANRVAVTFTDQPVYVVETFNGSSPDQPTDGARTQWTLSDPNIGGVGVTVNGSMKTAQVAGIGATAEWYYTNNGTEVVQDASGTPLASTDEISFSYFKTDDVVVVAENSADIAARAVAEITAGIHERKLTNAVGGYYLSVIAQEILDLIDDPSRTFAWEGNFNDWNTAMPGEGVTMRIGSDINVTTVIRSVQIVEIDKGHVRKRFEAISGPIIKDGFETFAGLGKSGPTKTIINATTGVVSDGAISDGGVII